LRRAGSSNETRVLYRKESEHHLGSRGSKSSTRAVAVVRTKVKFAEREAMPADAIDRLLQKKIQKNASAHLAPITSKQSFGLQIPIPRERHEAVRVEEQQNGDDCSSGFS